MKKWLVIIVISALVGAGWWLVSKHTSTAAPVVQIQAPTSKPDASNATFDFEDGPVTLVNGTSDNVDLTNYVAYGDVNQDGKNDTAVILVQSGSGSGVFIYVAAYLSGNINYKGSNAVFIGDRVSPQSITVDTAGIITVNYLDRGPNDPMASDPTVPTTKSFIYANGQLVEK